jgi:hypothetical protein
MSPKELPQQHHDAERSFLNSNVTRHEMVPKLARA